ncbi:BTAD domain-containing putative transcriptional regulator [Streptomyces avermitilis]
MPSRGPETLYGYVSRLRKALAPSGVDIVSDQGGYRLSVELAAVDVHRFRRLADQARAADTDEHAVALWQEALELWRGEAFAGPDTSWSNDQRSRLDAERLAAQIDLADARQLGRHGVKRAIGLSVIPGLLAAVAII